MTNQLEVFFDDKLVGTLALSKGHNVAFQYSDEWLTDGFSISPFSLPLKKQVFLPDKTYFGGLFGVFADSLPDAWGNVLMDRFLIQHGYKPEEVNILDRLAMIGDSGMGALCYHPVREYIQSAESIDLDEIASECLKILNAEDSGNLDLLYQLGGSSGGARPKVMTQIDDKDLIVKFPAHVDSPNIGQMEYDYSLCAKKCGIKMTDTYLLASQLCDGYFGTTRFDRYKTETGFIRFHVLTAAALLETDYRQPSLDYHALMKMTKILTHDNKEDLENMFLRMCFNVLAHNRDDHAKNFSYYYDTEQHLWRLAPAYDLTHSDTYFGEHTTSVDYNGKNPGKKEIVNVGTESGLSKKRCTELFEFVDTCVNTMLGNYL